MKAFLSLALTFGIAALLIGADDKKEDKKFDAAKMVGKWKLTDGKKAGTAVPDESKKGHYVITKDKIQIQDDDGKDMFVIEYTLDTKVSPVAIDMKITSSPGAGDSVNGQKGLGIVEVDGDSFKICYDVKGENRPAKFDGDKFHSFTFKRVKEEKK